MPGELGWAQAWLRSVAPLLLVCPRKEDQCHEKIKRMQPTGEPGKYSSSKSLPSQATQAGPRPHPPRGRPHCPGSPPCPHSESLTPPFPGVLS